MTSGYKYTGSKTYHVSMSLPAFKCLHDSYWYFEDNFFLFILQHFVCENCNQELGSRNFFEREGKPYCEDCNQELFSPRCGRCGEAILDKCVTALDQNFHPECFCCSDCGKAFGDNGYHEKGNRALCQVCTEQTCA